MIFTLNEEVHLPICLASLHWCDDIIVVDSYSSDRSVAICEAAGARVFQRKFDGFGSQRNWALAETSPRHEWILILDADERVPPELVDELATKLRAASPEVAAFSLARRFHMWGRWLRHSSLYPSYVVRLVRRGRVSYVNRGHAETQVAAGTIERLDAALIDENLKGLDEWFQRQNKYSRRDAEYELTYDPPAGNALAVLSRDPLTRRAALKRLAAAVPFRPIWYFIYSYLFRGGFLDGRDGFHFCVMRSTYLAMVDVKKYDLRRRAPGKPPDD